MVYEKELTFQHAYVERAVADSSAALRAREYLADQVPLRVISSREDILPERRNHRTLFIADSPAGMFKRCPGQNGHVCCNYLTVDLYAGCPLGCSYCIMKSYLASSPITVYADLRPAIAGIRETALANPDRTIRVGTGEVGDSLLYDPIFRLSEELIRGVADLPNVRLELKTKTISVDHLLGIEEKGKTVIGFSLNPPEVVAKEEGIAASLEERLAAAHRVSEAGYGLAFHFDPIIRVDGWERLYRGVVDRLSIFDGRDVAWISLGTVRFTKALREKMEDRPYLYDEFFPSGDGKLRYLQRERVAVYRRMREWLSEAVAAPVYLCMESRAVWNRAFDGGPEGSPSRRMTSQRPEAASEATPGAGSTAASNAATSATAGAATSATAGAATTAASAAASGTPREEASTPAKSDALRELFLRPRLPRIEERIDG